MRWMAFVPLLPVLACESADPRPTSVQNAPQADPTSDTGPRDESGRGDVFPWLLVEVPAQDIHGLLDYVAAVSGYLKVVAAQADPPWTDPLLMTWTGAMNPNARLQDVDGDGNPDITGDMDTFALAMSGITELPQVGLIPGEVHRDVQLRVGVVGYDILGRIFVERWADQPVVMTGIEPAFVRLPALPPFGSVTPCYDGLDDDGDGWVDLEDPDCRPGGPLIEAGAGTSTCNDGADNDGDGAADREDPGCEHGGDLSEVPSCSDGLDDDGDTWTDAEDPDCELPGARENGFGVWTCNDGVDNDATGFIDALDDRCSAGARASEAE